MKMMQQFGLSFADCDIIVNNVGADTFIYLKNVLDKQIFWTGCFDEQF